MTTIVETRKFPPQGPSGIEDASWRIAAISLLAVRFIQGFIFWGGGSRRFIYAPDKLVPDGHWMANKLQSAMPGALLGTDHVISFLLTHFDLLYASLIIFSAGELVAGAMLMAGLLTRLAALASIGFSIVLMLMFGWQGATCIDEWTMAACNLAMGATLLLAGSGAYSLDNVLLGRNPVLAGRSWFRWLGGSLPLPMSDRVFRVFGLSVLALTIAFNVGTYNYYRGSVVTPFHKGPVDPAMHHVSLAGGAIHPDGRVQFHAYLDGGTPEAPSHIMEIILVQSADGAVVEHWNTNALAHLPAMALQNDYAYQQFKSGPYGIVAEVGAKATIDLPSLGRGIQSKGVYILKLFTVDGQVFTLPIGDGGAS